MEAHSEGFAQTRAHQSRSASGLYAQLLWHWSPKRRVSHIKWRILNPYRKLTRVLFSHIRRTWCTFDMGSHVVHMMSHLSSHFCSFRAWAVFPHVIKCYSSNHTWTKYDHVKRVWFSHKGSTTACWYWIQKQGFCLFDWFIPFIPV